MKTTILAMLAACATASEPGLIAEHWRELAAKDGKPLAPGQPASGPGGAACAHASMRESAHGSGGTQYWLFEPQEPQPKSAPVVIFLHGWSAMEPWGYREWIAHIVRRGHTVIYPRYQERLLTPPGEFLDNTIHSVRAALAVLAEKDRVAPDLTRTAVAGHSAGAVTAMNFAARAAREKLPVPRALAIIQPGQGPERGVQFMQLADYSDIAAETRLLVAVGDRDSVVGRGSADRIWMRAAEFKHRALVTVRTDEHGLPVLRAGHLSPLAADAGGTDTLDWLGWWRLTDEAIDAAFAGREMQIDPAMGNWSDGTPVKPLVIVR